MFSSSPTCISPLVLKSLIASYLSVGVSVLAVVYRKGSENCQILHFSVLCVEESFFQLDTIFHFFISDCEMTVLTVEIDFFKVKSYFKDCSSQNYTCSYTGKLVECSICEN